MFIAFGLTFETPVVVIVPVRMRSVTPHPNPRTRSRRELRNTGKQLGHVKRGLSGDFHDDIAWQKSGAFCWTVLLDTANQHTVRATERERLRQLARHGLRLDAEPS